MGAGPRPRCASRRTPGGFEDVDFSQFFGDRYGGDPGGGFGDIFAQFRRAQTGRGRKPAPSKRGEDLVTELEVPFTTAILGGEAQLSVRRQSGELETIVVKIPRESKTAKKSACAVKAKRPTPARARPATS